MYKCKRDFELEVYDSNGFSEGEYSIVKKESSWFIPDDTDYRFIGGEIRLQDADDNWIEINKETLEEYFEEVFIMGN